jgi:hypothetical protein
VKPVIVRAPSREFIMSLDVTCRHCNITISADDETTLVTRVQEHAGTHERPHQPTREQVLARLRRQQKRSTSPDPPTNPHS